MDIGSLILLALSFTTIFVLIQRSEAKRRRIVIFCMLPVILLIVWYSNMTSLQTEAFIGFLFGTFTSFLFWLLIGRYNPVGSSDDIHVLGLDD
jgi:Na+(H+)/acetate symporter ActP